MPGKRSSKQGEQKARFSNLECLKQSGLEEAISFRFEQTDEAFALTAA
jgi:hypothetical protein